MGGGRILGLLTVWERAAIMTGDTSGRVKLTKQFANNRPTSNKISSNQTIIFAGTYCIAVLYSTAYIQYTMEVPIQSYFEVPDTCVSISYYFSTGFYHSDSRRPLSTRSRALQGSQHRVEGCSGHSKCLQALTSGCCHGFPKQAEA